MHLGNSYGFRSSMLEIRLRPNICISYHKSQYHRQRGKMSDMRPEECLGGS